MAGELKVETRIAIVFDPLLGQIYNQIESQVGKIEKLAVRIGDALRVTTQNALPLATAFKNANEAALESATKWQGALADIDTKLSRQLQTTLPQLTKAYQQLGQAMETVRSPGTGEQSKSEQDEQRILAASDTVLKAGKGTVEKFASYDSIANRLTIQGENDKTKWVELRAFLDAQTGKMSHGTSFSRTESVSLIDRMVAEGMMVRDAGQDAVVAVRLADSMQLSESTTAGVIRTVRDNGVSSEELYPLLNTVVGQVGNGRLGMDKTADALTRLVPQVGADGKEDIVRLVAILQQQFEKTTNIHDVISTAKERFREYKEQGGSKAPDLGRFGQQYMPKSPEDTDYIEEKLVKRRTTPEWQLKARESSNERLSLAVGTALALPYAVWTNLMTSATNTLAVVVETLSWVVTGIGAVVLGVAGLLKTAGMVAQGKALSDVFRRRGPGGEGGGSGGGASPWWSRLVVLGAGFKAYDTYQNATTPREKWEGYSEAAGMLIGAVFGPRLRIGAVAGGLILGALGKFLGGWAYDRLGADSKEVTPPLAALPGAELSKMLERPNSGISLLKEPGEKDESVQGPRNLAPVISLQVGSVGEVFEQRDGKQALQIQSFASSKTGDVVRDMSTTTQALSLPDPGALTSSTVTNNTSQQIAVAPNISINVQGVVTDPMDFIRVITPEMNRIVEGLVAGANRGGQNYDVIDQNLGLV